MYTLRIDLQTALFYAAGVVGADLEGVSTSPGNQGCGSVRSFSCNEKRLWVCAVADYYRPLRQIQEPVQCVKSDC